MEMEIQLLVHIRKVDIFGFKSFGFRNTTVNFEPGLVSISGPNGSGKSNILDAIIFAMGENRPKTMRVDKLRSLIHDIEGGRHGPKMARVSILFDNTDRKIPIDSDSVTLTRELDDKGENVYYLEKKKTNRAHVLDLLDMANAGLNQLNAVQQGTVTRISEFSPEEKRQAIEDLIGLSYFDEKKSEAVKQLDAADRRLEVALAKMGEIKKRIDELEEERNHKLRNDFLHYEINRFNAILAANKLKTIKGSKLSKERNLNALSSEIKKFDEERTTIKTQVHEIDSQKKKFMEEVDAYNQAKASIESELTSAIQQYERQKSEINTSKRRLEHIDSRLPEIKKTLEALRQDRSVLENQINQLKESIRLTNEEQRKITDEVKTLDAEHHQMTRQQSRIFSQKREADKKIKNLVEKLNSIKLSLSKTISEKTEIKNKIETNFKKNNQAKIDINNLVNLKTKLESVSTNHKAAIDELKSRISKLYEKKNKADKDIEELSLILEKSTQAATQYDAKIKVVKRLMHEDYSIAKLKEDSESLGIKGLAFELLTWDKKYERAVLAVSSDWIKSFVVKDFSTLLSLAEFAKQKNLPKIKIIPLDAIPKFKLTPPENSDVLGVLSDFVNCDSKFSSLKAFLFGNTVLVKSKDAAHKISKSGYKTVTLSGEFFEAKSSAAVIDINSKISKLTKIISLSTSIEGLNQSIHLLKKYTQKKKTNLKKIEDTISGYKERLSISETGLATTQSNLTDLRLKLDSAIKMTSQLESRNSYLKKRQERLEGEEIRLGSHIDSLEERISIMQDNYADPEQHRILGDLSRVNEKRSTLLAKQTEIVSKLREQQSQLASVSASEESEKSKAKNLNEEHASLNKEKHELEVQIRNLEKEITSCDESLIQLREKEQKLISTSGNSVGKVAEFDENLQKLREKEHSLTKEINSLERQSDSLSRDLKDLTEKESQIVKTLQGYGFSEDIETFEVEPLLQALYAEQRVLTESINTKAPETFLEISKGYRSMSTRKNELEEERNTIVKFIEEIEKDKRQTFLDAFDKVDHEIRYLFTKMTGGNAWLELQNEDDIFSSGLSYLIQFPNKPKRESTSISGGEKTLAAVVFVLALQKLKPSPFYLFDEVDAHLDAPNSEKLSKIIEERSKGSQFLMVSLKDSVVQKAKLIYGVYPKNGVSHVVTYKDKRMPSITN